MDHSEVKHLPKVDHTPAEFDEASRLLLKAAAEIEKRGWCQEALVNGAGNVCILGALNVVDSGSATVSPDNAAQTEAYLRLIDSIGCVSGWNNRFGRTKDEVVAKLRAVALGVRA